MKGTLRIDMEVDGMLMDVVAEYARYGPNCIRLEAVMDRDGEPLDLTQRERDQLRSRINSLEVA